MFFASQQVRGGRSRALRSTIERLEGRVVLSAFHVHASALIAHPASVVRNPNPPRTGGLAVQSGSVLSCFVGQPRMNTVNVVEDGMRDVQMTWNSGQPHSFAEVSTSVIQAERAPTNLFEIEDFSFDIEQTLAVRKISPVALGVEQSKLAVTGNSGHAVQTGTVLTITVNRPKTNIVQITSEGAGNDEVEWNGGRAHSFSGVAKLIVHTKNGRKDQLTLSDAIAG